MNVSKLFLTSLLAAGALVAISPVRAQTTNTNSAATSTRPRPERGNPADNRLMYLSQQLGLTEEQKPKVHAVLEEEFKGLQGVPREQRREKMAAMQEETSKKLKDILTPEQYTKYQALPGRGAGRRGGGNNGGQPEQPKTGETPKP